MAELVPLTADVATIHQARDVILRIRLQIAGGHQVADIRRFEPFAGPARVMTASRVGITLPVENLAELIEALKAAEHRFRAHRAGGAQ